MSRHEHVEQATYRIISGLRLCELNDLRQAYLDDIHVCDREIFQLSDSLERCLLNDRIQTREIKKELREVCDSRSIITAKLRACNRLKDHLELIKSDPSNCPKRRKIEAEPAGYN